MNIDEELCYGKGRTRVCLCPYRMGDDLVIAFYNKKAHIGAVALADYDHVTKRTSCSLITRLGHKDDAIAVEAAYSISKHIHRPVCVIAGIHIDNISRAEIDIILNNTRELIRQLSHSLRI